MFFFKILLVSVLFLSVGFSEVVARLDGREITAEEFKRVFNLHWKKIFFVRGRKPTLEDKKLVLYEYLKSLIIEKTAKEMGIEVSDKEVKKRLRKWGIRRPSEGLKEAVRRELLVQRILHRIGRDVRVTDEEIRVYYMLNKREFYYPNQIKLLRIVVDSKKTAYKVYRLLKRGKGIPGHLEGVRVGSERWYSLQALPRLVKRRIYPYRVGTVSRPIYVGTGYLILKVVDKRKEGFLPLEEVKERVREKLLKEKREEVLKRWFREVLKNHHLEIYLEKLRSL